MTSAAGATLTRLPDGSVLAGGLNPVVDTYTVEAMTGLSGITGLRLEALPDPSLPRHGPGRDPGSGNFHLDAIRLSTASPGRSAPVPVRLTRACADYSDPRSGPLGRERHHRHGPDHRLVDLAADGPTSLGRLPGRRPIGTGAGTRLRVELAFRIEVRRTAHWAGSACRSRTGRSRFRTELEEASRPTRSGTGLTRLGAAYFLLGDWASAAAVLDRAAARPDASALDGFLLALARHHLGRLDEARSDCDRALERLEAAGPTRRPMTWPSRR